MFPCGEVGGGSQCRFSPVMLLGVTVLRKKYPLAKYLCVLLIVTGVALFMYKPKKGAGGDDHIFGYGELLLVSAAGAQRAQGCVEDGAVKVWIQRELCRVKAP